MAPLALIVGAAVAFFALDQEPVTDGKGVAVRDFTTCTSANRTHFVVDGDTIRYGGDIIRLEDIDTPEISQATCASEKALGERAKRRLLELLNEARTIEAVYNGVLPDSQGGACGDAESLRRATVNGERASRNMYLNTSRDSWGVPVHSEFPVGTPISTPFSLLFDAKRCSRRDADLARATPISADTETQSICTYCGPIAGVC